MKKNKPIPLKKVLVDLENENPGITAEIKAKAKEYRAIVRLREARILADISQEELSIRSGVSRDKISKIESGKQNVTIETLSKISLALGKQLEIKFK